MPLVALLPCSVRDATHPQSPTRPTTLSIAALRAPKELVQALVDAGADIDAKEKGGRRLTRDDPATIAAKSGRSDTADYLKELGVAMNAVKFAGRMKAKTNAPAA